MLYMCIVDYQLMANFVKPAYDNYRDPKHDLTIAKDVLIHYIRKNYENDKMILPSHANAYKLNLFGKNKLRLNIKGNDDLTFMICTKSRKLYVV